MKLDLKKVESCPCGCDVDKDARGRWKVMGDLNDQCTCGCLLLRHATNCKCQSCFYEEDGAWCL
jgi:hypothetical protein